MKNFMNVGFLAVSILFFATTAKAESYCWANNAHLVADSEATVYWKVVVATKPRVFIPGKGKREWCSYPWSSLGPKTGFTVLEKPSLGEIKTGTYTVSYRSEKIGHDRFIIENHWFKGSENKALKGKVIYEVDVVAEPM